MFADSRGFGNILRCVDSIARNYLSFTVSYSLLNPTYSNNDHTIMDMATEVSEMNTTEEMLPVLEWGNDTFSFPL